MLVMLTISFMAVVIFCLSRFWPSREKTEDFVIGLYIEIFCEK